MELWRELLISGLQNESNKLDYVNDKLLKQIIDCECYRVLMLIKQAVDDEKLSDNDCFIKIERILRLLEQNNVLCNRHDFG